MLKCRFFDQNSVISQKKVFFRKLEKKDFILRMPETAVFACALSKILERSKSIYFGSKYSARLQIENFGSKRFVLVLDLEQIVPI